MNFETLVPIWLIVCPLSFLGGLIDAVAGGGGLITLPAYLLAGLPPHMAIGTNKCGNVFGTFAAMVNFVRKGHYHLKSAAFAAVGALIGAYSGSSLNMLVSEKALYYLMIFAVPVLAFFILRKKDFGSESFYEQFSEKKLSWLSLFVGLALGLYDGFFGPGAGTFMMLAFAGICGFDLLTASGNTKICNTASNFASVIAFALGGQIMWAVGIAAAVCNIIGASIGANIALKKGAKIIRPMFIVVLCLLIFKLIFDLIV